MAKRDKFDEDIGSYSVATASAVGPMDEARIFNMSNAVRQYTLANGTVVSAGPMGYTKPVLKKLIGPTLKALEKRGVIRIEGGA